MSKRLALFFGAIAMSYIFGATYYFFNGTTDSQNVSGEVGAASTSSTAATFIAFGLYAASAVYLLLKVRWLDSRVPLIIPAMIVLAGLSVLWSEDRHNSVTSFVSLVGLTALGLFFASYYRGRIDALLTTSLILVICASLVASLLVPELQETRNQAGLSWRGLFDHKNTFGAVCALGVGLSSGLFAVRLSKRRAAPAALLLLSTVGVALSGSRTSWIVSIVAIIWAVIYRMISSRSDGTAIGSLFLALGAGLAVIASIGGDYISLTDLLGRDLTLTGRSELWSALFDLGTTSPILGFGFNAVWHGANPAAVITSASVGWFAGQAHNGYLDLWLQLGVCAPVLFLFGLVSVLVDSVRRGAKSATAISTPFILTLSNLTEDYTLRGWGWLLLVMLLVSVRGELCLREETSKPLHRAEANVLDSRGINEQISRRMA